MASDHTFAVLAYRESPYIESCLESLKNQTVKSQIIICTSTPSDFLDNLALKYSVKLLVNSQPPGIGSDWNFAYRQATTKYVTLAHQDDLYEKNYTEMCLKSAKVVKDCQIVFTDYNEIINGVKTGNRRILVIKRMLLWPFILAPVIRNKFLKRISVSFGSPIPCPSVMYNKTVLGKFSFSESLKTNLDWLAWIQLSQEKGAWVRVSEKLMSHRIHRESETSNNINNSVRDLEDFFIFEQLWGKTLAKILLKIYRASYKSNFEKL